jgi:hypothetical protein
MPEIKPLRWRWLDWTLVSTATIVAGVLRFHALDRKPFWLDEGVKRRNLSTRLVQLHSADVAEGSEHVPLLRAPSWLAAFGGQ